MSSRLDTLRTFIAIELSPSIVVRIAELQSRMRNELPPRLVRWVRAEGIHLTLKFLGEIPAAQVDAIGEAIRTACARHPPFSFHITDLGCFPNPRRPRVIWVGVDEPSGVLAGLQHDIDRSLVPLGFAPEKRAFHPHLTLGRVKESTQDGLQLLGAYLSRSQVSIGQQRAMSVSLMRSDLQPSGAIYTQLASAQLVANQPVGHDETKDATPR